MTTIFPKEVNDKLYLNGILSGPGHSKIKEMLAYCVEHMYDCDLSNWSIEDKKTMLRLCRMFDINRQSLGWNSDEVENES